MALLKRLASEASVYKDRRFEGDEADWKRALATTSTLYVGNLSFYTREEQIYEVFSKCGHVERIIMGLDKNTKTPCGFCFVLYYRRSDASAAVRYLNATVLDDRAIRVDYDWGFVEGRQWGRGRSGGQVRDEFRTDYDAGRGGFGKVLMEKIVSQSGMLGGMMGGGMQESPLPVHEDKRRRMETPPQAPAQAQQASNSRAVVEDNPRFKSREKRRGDSDDER